MVSAFYIRFRSQPIDLAEDPDEAATPLRGGFVLRIGRRSLINLLIRWQSVGINHVVLGVQYGRRPASEVLAELAQEVLPHFPTHAAPLSIEIQW
nr:hypothetical protein [Chroococcidiopsis cubana]